MQTHFRRHAQDDLEVQTVDGLPQPHFPSAIEHALDQDQMPRVDDIEPSDKPLYIGR
jgi:hypothetical protein